MGGLKSPVAPFEGPSSCHPEIDLTAAGYALGSRVTLVPILRAGVEMVDPLLELLPDASVRHLGIFREKISLAPTEYYNRLPVRTFLSSSTADRTQPKPDCDLALILDRASSYAGTRADSRLSFDRQCGLRAADGLG